MTGVTTGQLALATATDSDDTQHFLTVDLTADLQTLDNKFHNSTGHNHDASGEGAPITTAGIADGSITAAKVAAAAWTAFTPTLSQPGALTLSLAVGRYIQLGKIVIFSVDIVVNSAGTVANQIILSGLPVASAQRGVVGSGWFFDSSAGTTYPGSAVWQTSTSCSLLVANSTNNGIGVAPAVAAAALDQFHLTGTYEAA